MKIFIFGFLFYLISFGSFGKYDKSNISSDSLVYIQYTNLINGYYVKVKWIPNQVINSHTIGPAIIEFFQKKDSILFSITTNKFGVLSKELPFEYSEDSLFLIKIQTNKIELKYNNLIRKNLDQSFFDSNEPFFFQDINFDNIDDLILVEHYQAQRETSRFIPYDLKSIVMYQEWSDNNLRYYMPYKEFDGFSSIDYRRRQIHLYHSGGACAGEEFVYEYLPLDEIEYIHDESLESRVAKNINYMVNNDYFNTKMILKFYLKQVYNNRTGACNLNRYRINLAKDHSIELLSTSPY